MSGAEHCVLVIGAAGLDVKVYPRDRAVEPAQSNPANIRWGWGGVARNIAENLARLGADVHFVTAVGDDPSGSALLQSLGTLGIHTDASIVVPAKPTCSYVALHHYDKQLWLAFEDMDIMRALTPGHIHRLRGLIKTTDMVCIDANLSARTLETLFRLTRQFDVPVCVDPTTAALAPRLHPYLPDMAVITPNKEEAEALVGASCDTPEAIGAGARRLVQLGVELAVITLGAEGLFYATAEESGRLPALPVDAVDPTGAGDALTAAVAYGLLENMSPEETVRLGLTAATQTILCHETVCPTLNLEMLYEHLVL
ncbi:MAG TPA: carbohydrate kinase family protein [Anaerolineae bacterium]|nr:carbohydrate kinase family protein [Anaerolineae bacterium]HQH38156.1 carbohydrate kinase family protein [Anaerolineae bacterium]